MEKIKLTYFTPTYNREKLLPRLYNSLLTQKNKNFIWLIVDDGSTDNTETLVNNWKKENKIKIEYIKKENGGKHTAIDLSNQVCTTEFITCIDSDDYITPNCTDVLYSYFQHCTIETCCGLVGPKTILNSQNQATWNVNDKYVFFYDLDKYMGTIPETTLIFKTEIAKQFHFPIFKDERFVTESVYYKQFLYNFKLYTFNEEVYIAEYQNDGYTKQGMKLFINNPKGYACCLKQETFLAINKYKKPFIKRIKIVMRYYGWKSLFKIKQDVMPEYKINWFYKMVGKTTSFVSKQIIKRRLKNEK